ncbi:MAG: hypothetical protein ACI84O_001361 [Myxococcota bacterium]|jgi:hypothetical protein
MKFSLFVCGAALFVSCAAQPPTDNWSEGSLAIALTLEQQAQQLTAITSQAFGAANSQHALAMSACAEIEHLMRGHSLAWRALFSYATTIEKVLAKSRLDSKNINAIAQAFNELHSKLLQTNIATHFGVDLNTHRQIISGIQQSSSTRQALMVVSLGVAEICQELAKATTEIVEQLDALNMQLLELQKLDNLALLERNQLLLARQQRYKSAVDPRYDAEFEMLQVAKEITANQVAMSEMDRNAEALNKLFLDNKLLLQQCVSAYYEWGLCSQALTKSSVAVTQDFRLFQERAEVISGYE